MHKWNIDKLSALFFLIVTLSITLFSFMRMGAKARDALVLTGYVIQIMPGYQKSFGYGGDSEAEKPDVLFQSREMSNISFVIARDASGQYGIIPQDDTITIHRVRYEARQPGQEDEQNIPLSDGDLFQSQGPLGISSFTVDIDSVTDTLLLRLRSPLYFELNTSTMRLLVGTSQDPVLNTMDEVFIRSNALEHPGSESYRMWVQRGNLYLDEDIDFASPETATNLNEADARIPVSQLPASALVTTPRVITPKESLVLGTANLTFRDSGSELLSLFGMKINQVSLFGIKFVLAILFIGFAFLVAPQVRWPLGFTIFSCAALFSAIALILSSRDFFFYPHSERVREYLFYLFLGVMMVLALRVPFDPDESDTSSQDYIYLLRSFFCFLIAYILVGGTFDSAGLSFKRVILEGVKVLLWFLGTLILSWIIQLSFRSILIRMGNLSLTDSGFRKLIWLPILFFTIILLTALMVGGREAITFLGLRFHLPTLFLPLTVLWISLLVFLSESTSSYKEVWVINAGIGGLLIIFGYRLISGDNGGSAILAAGFMSVLWLGSRNLRLPLFVTALVVTVSIFLAVSSQSTRFILAWGGNEDKLIFYDQEKNLRIGRDLARSGGFTGQYSDIVIPAEIRSNIHTDLIADYISGFFGWAFIAILILAYLIFYSHLYGGLYKLSGSYPSNSVSKSSDRDPRKFLVLFSASLVLTFAFQTIWVMSASLQKVIPLTGLDLQPISSSAISVLGFFGVLLSSVALSHTLNKTLP